MTDHVLEVENLCVWFPLRRGLKEIALLQPAKQVRAVDCVTFALAEGESLGLVGESGCGKSTLGRAVLRLVRHTAGSVSFGGEEISGLKRMRAKAFRRQAQMVFQDPYSSLNPKLTVRTTLAEVLRVHRLCDSSSVDREIARLMQEVGLDPGLAGRRPRALSGGQCQRVVIARALALGPRMIVADESVSALDVSIQAQILNLFVRLQRTHRLAMLFISHDLSVVRHICHRVAVMYLGRVVEIGATEDIFRAPKHPYTQALLAAKPKMNGASLRDTQLLSGEPPSPLKRPKGCAFHPRCPHVMPQCRQDPPPAAIEMPTGDVACHLY